MANATRRLFAAPILIPWEDDMGGKLIAWVFITLLLIVLLWAYQAYPDQRAILLFGTIFSAALCKCADGGRT